MHLVSDLIQTRACKQEDPMLEPIVFQNTSAFASNRWSICYAERYNVGGKNPEIAYIISMTIEHVQASILFAIS